jgi:hypothetical protein
MGALVWGLGLVLGLVLELVLELVLGLVQHYDTHPSTNSIVHLQSLCPLSGTCNANQVRTDRT